MRVRLLGVGSVVVTGVFVAWALTGHGFAGEPGGHSSPSAVVSQRPAPSPADAADSHSGHNAATVVAHAPLRTGERFLQIAMAGPYTPSAPSGGKDDYRCFLVDPHLTSNTFITGAEVVPGQPALVHHAILFRVTPGQVAAARAYDATTPGQGWTCFGNSAVPGDGNASPVGALDSAPWLAGWAPGGGESVFARGTGVRLAAGSQIVLQVHYNLRAINQATGPDITQVRLRLAPGTASLAPIHTMLLVAPIELPCTPQETGPLCDRSAALVDLSRRFGQQAGATVAGLQLLCGGTSLVAPKAGPTLHCDRPAPRRMVVRAVAGHMHLLGRSISVTLNPKGPHPRTLLDRLVWDFDNQRATPLKRPVVVQPGDTLRVTCTHDASLRALLPALANEQPRYVMWGEGTADEMCLGIVLYTLR